MTPARRIPAPISFAGYELRRVWQQILGLGHTWSQAVYGDDRHHPPLRSERSP